MISVMVLDRQLIRIATDSCACFVILNKAKRSEGSGLRTEETSRPHATSFAFGSG
jgi:hypothetical protein